MKAIPLSSQSSVEIYLILPFFATQPSNWHSERLFNIMSRRSAAVGDTNPGTAMMQADRAIIHIDMDAFYAASEQRDRPELRSRVVIVGGSPDQRGVVSTCSYEARRYGLRVIDSVNKQVDFRKHSTYLQKFRHLAVHLRNHLVDLSTDPGLIKKAMTSSSGFINYFFALVEDLF
jgi:hypothetical protein